MAWVKIDDSITQNPKIAAAGPLAMAMHLAAICYCNRELTDGFVPRAIARTLLDWQYITDDDKVWSVGVTCGHRGEDVTSPLLIPILVETGLWEEVPGGYRIHDYLDYQASRDQVMAAREGNARRVMAHREKKRQNGPGDNGPAGGLPAPTHTTGSNAITPSVTSTVTPALLMPDVMPNVTVGVTPPVTPLKKEELRREEPPPPPVPPVPRRAPDAPVAAPAPREGEGGADYVALVGTDWDRITAGFLRLSPNLSPTWLVATLGKAARASPGLTRDQVLDRLRLGYVRLEETAEASGTSPPDKRIRSWSGFGEKRLLDAFKETRYDDENGRHGAGRNHDA